MKVFRGLPEGIRGEGWRVRGCRRGRGSCRQRRQAVRFPAVNGNDDNLLKLYDDEKFEISRGGFRQINLRGRDDVHPQGKDVPLQEQAAEVERGGAQTFYREPDAGTAGDGGVVPFHVGVQECFLQRAGALDALGRLRARFGADGA